MHHPPRFARVKIIIMLCLSTAVAGQVKGEERQSQPPPPNVWQLAGIGFGITDSSENVRSEMLALCLKNAWDKWLNPTQVVLLLKDADPLVRQVAAETLDQMEKEGAAVGPQVVRLLKDTDPDMRQVAVEALGRMGKEGAPFAPQIVPLLKDTESVVRQVAAEALGRMGKEGAPFAPQIVPLLKDSEPVVCQVAAEALGRMGKEGAALAAQIVPLLKDTEPVVRYAAAASLGQMGEEGAPFAPQVVPLLKDSEPVVRQLAAEALGRMGKEGAALAAQIVPLLKDTNSDVRRAAAEALVQMGEEGAAFGAQIVPLIEDSDSGVRKTAAKSLGQMGKKGAPVGAQVAPLLMDTEPFVRRAAAESLGQMGEEGAAFAGQIVPLLKDTDSDVRKSAAKALGHMGKEGAAVSAQVAPLLMDTEPFVRRAAAESLGQMGEEGATFAGQIAPLLRDTDSGVRKTAAESLGQMGKAGAAFAAQVFPLLKDTDPIASRAAGVSLEKMAKEGAPFAAQIIPLLKDTDPLVRRTAAFALELVGKKGAPFGAQVFPLLKDTDLIMRRAAVEALGQMGKESALFAAQIVPLLKDINPVRSAAAAALGWMGKEGAPFAAQVVPLLKDTDPDVRSAAARALGQMGEESAPFAPQVVALLKDTDPHVRSTAMTALDTLGTKRLDPACQAAVLDTFHVEAPSKRAALRAHVRLWSGSDARLQLLVGWLGDPEPDPMPTGKVSEREASNVLSGFLWIYDATEPYPKLRSELAQRVTDVAAAISWVPDAGMEETLHALSTKLEYDRRYVASVHAINDALGRKETGKWVRRVTGGVIVHAGCWLLLLFVYPRSPWVQTFCFWNSWFRKFLGFAYVGLVLRYLPVARRRLFAPFRDVLVADALLPQLDTEHWFADFAVRDEDSEGRLPLTTAVSSLQGQLVLIGDSGLGKTMFVRQLVRQEVRRGRIVAFLLAEDCGGGVLEALQKRLEGPAKDEAFLRDLVFAGAIDVCIDGLNQVPPDTRAKVADFMSQFVRGNMVVTMQPMEWRAPKLARRYRLEPLAPDKIVAFLQSREPALPEDAAVRGDAFKARCECYAADVLDERTLDPGDVLAARETLSNPLDATVAAELLAAGEAPDLFDLRTQQYETMAREYRDECGMDFPIDDVAEAAYAMRAEGRQEFPAEKFPRELTYLAQHRILLRRRSLVAGDGAETQWWTFRHEKFLEFFVVHAFRGPKRTRREQHLGDPPFRGVYLRLAKVLPPADAEALERMFIDYAAETGDHSTSDEYIRQLARRRAIETCASPKSHPPDFEPKSLSYSNAPADAVSR